MGCIPGYTGDVCMEGRLFMTNVTNQNNLGSQNGNKAESDFSPPAQAVDNVDYRSNNIIFHTLGSIVLCLPPPPPPPPKNMKPKC